MATITDLRTSTRVALGFGALILLLALIMAASVLRVSGLAAGIEEIGTSRVPKIVLGARAGDALMQTSRRMRDALVLDDEKQIRAELEGIAQNRQDRRELLGQVEAMQVGEEEASAIRAVKAAAARYEVLETRFLEMAAGSDRKEARELLVTQLRPAEAGFVEAMAALIDLEAATSDQAARDSRDHARETTVAMLATGIAAVLIGLFAAVFSVRNLRRRLGENSYAARVANGIASGDLTVDVEARRGDDAAILAAMKRMRDDLARAVGSIRGSAWAVESAAAQIAVGSTQLSARTEQQASSLEQTAASMEELAGTVRQTSTNAREADELARNAAARAEQGGAEVGKVVATMDDISRSAARISEIISVIDGIAFQTNILALNAAVEAARAGEQGRGFAVVASEVRSLAQRSAAAAREIKDLIGASVEQVGNGAQVVQRAGATIEALVADVKQVSGLMGAIAEASAEQSRGVEQVNKTVSEMDKVVQENASAVQESVSAAESMRRQAEELIKAVSAFRLAEAPAAARAPLPAAEPKAKPPPPRHAPMARAGVPAARAASTMAGAPDEEWQEF